MVEQYSINSSPPSGSHSETDSQGIEVDSSEDDFKDIHVPDENRDPGSNLQGMQAGEDRIRRSVAARRGQPSIVERVTGLLDAAATRASGNDPDVRALPSATAGPAMSGPATSGSVAARPPSRNEHRRTGTERAQRAEERLHPRAGSSAAEENDNERQPAIAGPSTRISTRRSGKAGARDGEQQQQPGAESSATGGNDDTQEPPPPPSTTAPGRPSRRTAFALPSRPRDNAPQQPQEEDSSEPETTIRVSRRRTQPSAKAREAMEQDPKSGRGGKGGGGKKGPRGGGAGGRGSAGGLAGA